MDPDVNDTNWVTEDKNDISKKVYIGKDLNKQFGIEAFWTDLGSAGMKSNSGRTGEINYKGYGANMIYNSAYKVGSFRPFAKLGVAKLKTTDKNQVTSKQLNKTSVVAGVGLEYEISNNLNIRAEYNHYDKDINNIGVGLNWSPNYRIHGASPIKPKPRPVKPKIVYVPKKVYVTKPAVKPKPVVKPKVVYVSKKVFVTKPAPKPRYRVLHRNLSGGSHFATGSSSLNYNGENALNRLVNDIKNQRISINSISVVGHTDNVGTRQANQILSMNRANTVANYLASRGLKRNMIQAHGRGESQPIADNKSSFGKAKNRRVEIIINGTSREVVRIQ